MSNVDKLVALGAYSCGGELLWKNRVMGHLRNGDLVLTEDGKQALAMDVTDVEVKEDRPKRKPKAEKVETPVAELTMDDILGDE